MRALLLAVALALSVRALAGAEGAANPSIVHTPIVASAHPTDRGDYRAQLRATAERYVQLYYSARYREALGVAQEGLAAAERAADRRDTAEFLKAIGYVSWLLGETAAASEAAQRLLVLAEELDDHALRSVSHRVQANVAQLTGDLAARRRHADLAYRHAERSGNESLRYGALNTLGLVALGDRDFATARRLHEEVLAYRERIGNRWDAAGSYSNLADIAIAEGNLPLALDLHERTLALRVEVGDQRGQVRSLRQTAAVLRDLGRTDEALARLRDALARAEKITGHELLGDTWREIARTHEVRREFAEALAAERKAHTAREALAGERTQARLAELQTRFDLAQKELTIAKLEHAQRLQQAELRTRRGELAAADQQRLALVVLLALAALTAAAVVSRQRLKLRTEQRIHSETRLARAAAEEADRIKTRFLGIASHDVRTPLGNIVALVTALSNTRPVGAADRQLLDLIGAEAQRVSSLVQDLLDVSAVESGQLKLVLAPVDLAEIVRAAVTEHTREAQAKRVQLSFVPPAVPVRVEGDARRLHQVAVNLLSNAVKFSPAGAAVRLAVDRRGDVVELSVRDDGAGIAPTDLQKIFVPYSRLAQHPTAGESSHGLGLSIVQEIVRRHGGRVRVESSPGQGTTFVVELPVLRAAPATAAV